jgi:ATP-dependent Clp protease protease subunit
MNDIELACPEEKENDQPQQEGFGQKLLKSRTVLLTGEVDQELAERIMAQLMILDADSHDPIRMIITSQGGHVDSGFAIHDMMRFVESDIHAIGAGWVASIAVPILFGAKKEHRMALPNTRFLLHQPSGGAGGQLQDIRIEAQEMLKIREHLNQLIADETGQPIERIRKDSDRNYWMSADEAKEYGIITKVVSAVSDVG